MINDTAGQNKNPVSPSSGEPNPPLPPLDQTAGNSSSYRSSGNSPFSSAPGDDKPYVPPAPPPPAGGTPPPSFGEPMPPPPPGQPLSRLPDPVPVEPAMDQIPPKPKLPAKNIGIAALVLFLIVTTGLVGVLLLKQKQGAKAPEQAPFQTEENCETKYTSATVRCCSSEPDEEISVSVCTYDNCTTYCSHPEDGLRCGYNNKGGTRKANVEIRDNYYCFAESVTVNGPDCGGIQLDCHVNGEPRPGEPGSDIGSTDCEDCQCCRGGPTTTPGQGHCNGPCTPGGSECPDNTVCMPIRDIYLCRNPECPDETDCECEVVITETPIPTATPTPPPVTLTCDDPCDLGNDHCDNNWVPPGGGAGIDLRCMTVGYFEGDFCRNPSCYTQAGCVCPATTFTPIPTATPTPTIIIGCYSNCTNDDQCPAGLKCQCAGHSCIQNQCVNPACPEESDCVCAPAATPTPLPPGQLACYELNYTSASGVSDPYYDEDIAFTCVTTGDQVSRMRFRYKLNNGAWVENGIPDATNIQSDIQITAAGRWKGTSTYNFGRVVDPYRSTTVTVQCQGCLIDNGQEVCTQWPCLPADEQACQSGGGTWKEFLNSCADVCNAPRSCLPNNTWSCDCPNGCWNDITKVCSSLSSGTAPTSTPSDERICAQSGGTWKKFTTSCADICNTASCLPAITWSCECLNGCWNTDQKKCFSSDSVN